MTFQYNPAAFLGAQPAPSTATSKLIILNCPLANAAILRRTWQHCNYRICADGGANRLLDFVTASGEVEYEEQEEFIPNSIHGDLDSVHDDTIQYYSSRNVPITVDGDQYSTDFGKAIAKVKNLAADRREELRDILILGSLSGRVDQGLGLLHEMYRAQMRTPDTKLWLVSECSVTFLLAPGRNEIDTSAARDHGDQPAKTFTVNVGILPLFGPAVITTQGLEWDVKDWHTTMGGKLSTSNHIFSDQVVVETDQIVLFTIELDLESL